MFYPWFALDMWPPWLWLVRNLEWAWFMQKWTVMDSLGEQLVRQQGLWNFYTTNRMKTHKWVRTGGKSWPRCCVQRTLSVVRGEHRWRVIEMWLQWEGPTARDLHLTFWWTVVCSCSFHLKKANKSKSPKFCRWCKMELSSCSKRKFLLQPAHCQLTCLFTRLPPKCADDTVGNKHPWLTLSHQIKVVSQTDLHEKRIQKSPCCVRNNAKGSVRICLFYMQLIPSL